MKKIIIINIVTLFIYSQTIAGGSNDNLQKYWIYRERIKNFMFESNGDGSSMIGTRGASNKLGTGDQPWQLGYWMATLAME